MEKKSGTLLALFPDHLSSLGMRLACGMHISDYTTGCTKSKRKESYLKRKERLTC